METVRGDAGEALTMPRRAGHRIRRWAAYELTGYMRTSAIRACWPRTESRLYEEPKNLVAHGLAQAVKERTGRRPRTVYGITAKGRRALRRWLNAPPAAPENQDEAMLKLLYADQGSRDQALATIRSAIEALHAQALLVLEFAPRVAGGEMRFPGRRHISALAARHVVGRMRARLEFLKWADQWIRTWSDTQLDEEKDRQAASLLADASRQVQEIERELRAARLADGATARV